jgi:alpha-mannosidase
MHHNFWVCPRVSKGGVPPLRRSSVGHNRLTGHCLFQAVAHLRCRLLSICAAMLLGCLPAANSAEPTTAASAAKDVFFLIPHTHWEGAVFLTREEYLGTGLQNILRAMRLLKAHPNYRFVLDQAAYVKPFLERYPEESLAFRQFVGEGRLAIVCGNDVMLDVNMPGGESYVRQVLYGKGYFRKMLGVDVTIGWALDTFGHHAQMPQLLKLGGYKSYWFFRGVPDWKTPSEFIWEGIDGSRIPAFWLPHAYGLLYGSPNTLPEFSKFFKERFDMLAPFARGRGRVGLAGGDVTEPEEHQVAMVEQFNRQPNAPFELRLAVPGDFEALVAKRSDRQVIGGELNPIFQGTYSSRIELKQRTRELETLLTSAEKLGMLRYWYGALPGGWPTRESGAFPFAWTQRSGGSQSSDDEILWWAWEPMLFNQTHDLMSGVMAEHVYQDVVRDYDFSKKIAQDEAQTRMRQIAGMIDSRGEGIPIAVFNMLGWPRTDLAVTNVGFSDSKVMGVKVVGPDGVSVPVQILDADRNGDGGLLRARVAFIARDVPAMGCSLYRVLPTNDAAAEKPASEPVLENDSYRIEFDFASGAMVHLLVKKEKWDVLRAPGNVVAREEDRGDLWEPYHTLDGASRIAMKVRHPAPPPGKGVFSSDQKGAAGIVSRGPVFSEFKIAHPFGKKGSFATTVRLYNGLRRIDVCTRLVNDERFVRYRVLFPTSIRDGQNMQEIPFGAIRRPDGIEFPAQNWIDYGDGRKGVALLNRGLPGNNVADGTMMLSLLRSTRIVSYGDASGGYGGGDDSSFELNKELTFDYALVPHAGDWREAGVYRDGMEFNHPLLTCPMSQHPGMLGARWGFLEIKPKNVILSSLKLGSDGAVVLRVYEATGRATTATVKIGLPTPPFVAEEVNLMEDPGRQLSRTEAMPRFDLRPFEIKTIKLRTRLP